MVTIYCPLENATFNRIDRKTLLIIRYVSAENDVPYYLAET